MAASPFQCDKCKFYTEGGDDCPVCRYAETVKPASDDDRLLWEAMKAVAPAFDWTTHLQNDAHRSYHAAVCLVAEFKRRTARKEHPDGKQ